LPPAAHHFAQTLGDVVAAVVGAVVSAHDLILLLLLCRGWDGKEKGEERERGREPVSGVDRTLLRCWHLF
jgi:hypothetical protein